MLLILVLDEVNFLHKVVAKVICKLSWIIVIWQITPGGIKQIDFLEELLILGLPGH